MTLDQLEIFALIVEKGSFKAAAEHLHRTQPTLSVAIKKLEGEFDLLLLSRDEYRPKLTPEGKVFYDWAKQVLRASRALSVVGNELGARKIEPRLMVVIDPLARLERIDAIFSECLQAGRPTELTLRTEILGVGMQLLLEQKADFAIASAVAPHADIESVPIDRIDMLPVVARSALGKNVRADADWLRDKPQIVVTSANTDADTAKPDPTAFGLLEGGKRCYVTDHSMKRHLIVNGFGWGRLADHEIAAELKARRVVKIEDEAVQGFTLDIHVMRNRLKPMGPVARKVWDALMAEGTPRQPRPTPSRPSGSRR